MGYIIRDGVIYGGGSSSSGDNIFHGTQAEWNALTTAEKAEYDFAAFTDDYDPSSISNPNLLDNPWFTINQRGKSSYTATNGNAYYTVDRWAGIQINKKAIKPKTNGGITVDYEGATSQISWYVLGQLLDTDVTENLKGKTVTMSIKISNIQNMTNVSLRLMDYDSLSLVSGMTEIARVVTANNGIYKVTFTMPTSFQGDKILFMIYGSTSTTEYATAKFDVDAVKLELGSVSTLAMDTAPNYATELLKCQRYFMRLKPSIGNTVVGIGFAGTASDLRVPISLPCEMRTTPTLTKSSASHYKYTKTTAAEATTASDVLLWSLNGTNATIRLIGTYDVSGTYIVYVSTTSAYIDLSADL